LQGRTSTLFKRKMADSGNDDRAVRPLPVFNGTKTGPSKKGDDGDSYAVLRARLVINLRAKRLLSSLPTTTMTKIPTKTSFSLPYSVVRRAPRTS
jgi:hypothetical protein